MKSLYETLEVSPHASIFVIRAAYRSLAQHGHPDKSPDSDEAGPRMANINRAYAVLSDLEKRKKYDQSQGFTQEFGERRGLGSLSTARGKLRDTEHPTTRPFAFRPLD